MASLWRDRSLTVRVLVLLSLALLPLGAISVWQTQRLAEAAPRQAKATLLSLTELASNPLQVAVQRAFGANEALIPGVLNLRRQPDACSRYLGNFLAQDGVAYSYAAFIEPTGQMRCSSDGRSYDFSAYEDFADRLADPKPTVVRNPEAPLSNQAVLIVTSVVRDSDGSFVGFLSLSLPEQDIDPPVLVNNPSRRVALVTLNAQGQLLAASEDANAVAQFMPRDAAWAEVAQGEGRSFIATDSAGQRRIYAVAPIEEGVAYAVGTWPIQSALLEDDRGVLVSAILPVLMWLVSLLVAFLALERLVLRPIRVLGRQMGTFAQTRRTASTPLLRFAGTELAKIEQDFLEMAEDIRRDEGALEASLREKNVLLKEVHHRVKNNLQLISSIMNMQARKLSSPEAKSVLRRVQDRVRGLAAVHRTLYQSENLSRVDGGAIVADLARQIAVGAPVNQPLDFHADVVPVEMDPDRAVTLALCVSELMTNAVSHAIAGLDAGTKPKVRLSLKETNSGGLCLTVSNSRLESDAAASTNAADSGATSTGGLGMQLIQAYAKQLDGHVDFRPDVGVYRIDLDFPAETDRAQPLDY